MVNSYLQNKSKKKSIYLTLNLQFGGVPFTTVRMKSLTMFSVDMHLLNNYKSNFAHISDLYSLVLRKYKYERRANKN